MILLLLQQSVKYTGIRIHGPDQCVCFGLDVSIPDGDTRDLPLRHLHACRRRTSNSSVFYSSIFLHGQKRNNALTVRADVFRLVHAFPVKMDCCDVLNLNSSDKDRTKPNRIAFILVLLKTPRLPHYDLVPQTSHK